MTKQEILLERELEQETLGVVVEEGQETQILDIALEEQEKIVTLDIEEEQEQTISVETENKQEQNIELDAENTIHNITSETNHANLENLDYENSGHTGFQKAGDYVLKKEVPTKVSQLENDSDYATKTYVDNEIATFDFIKVVDALPETGLPNKIYLIPKDDTQTQDLFDEYVWVNNKWEWVTTKQLEVDLTPYAKKTDLSSSNISYEDNLGYGGENVQDALDKAFDALDNKMNYNEFTEQVGIISDLETEDNSNLVNAINNVNLKLNDLPTIVPFIPQTKISQLIKDNVKYLKIEWNNNPSFLRYQNLGLAFLCLYKYTKSGRKHWVRDQQAITQSGVKKWVHPANGFTPKTNHQCWGIRSFEANTTFTENYSVDDIINDAEYPIANNGYVKTEYPLSVGQTSVLIPLNDIVSPILKVASIGTDAVVLPCYGDGLEVKLMGVKQNKNKGRCNQPIKFCLTVGTTNNSYVGSCLNVATIQLFKYRVTRDNHSMHGYDTRYSVLPDVGYSVYIK